MRIFDIVGRGRTRLEVVAEIGGVLRIVVASSPDALTRLRVAEGVPAVYIGLWRATPGVVVVGATASITERMRTQTWRHRGRPDAILACVGVEQTFDGLDALALERIVARAVGQRVFVDTGLDLPYGVARGPLRYAQLQALWVTSLPAIEAIAPPLACPWPGPADVVPAGPVPAKAATWRIEACGLSARAYECADGWVVLAGSRVRREPARCVSGAVMVLHEELQHAGMLIDDGNRGLLLTRSVRRLSRGGCTSFVFSHRGYDREWQRISRGRGRR